MRIVAAMVLSVLFFPAPAKAQEPTLPFSAPPADSDFRLWSVPQGFERTITPADAGPTLAAELERAGLCAAGESCRVRVRIEIYLKRRCIAQNDREYDCEQRMAWKSMETLGVAVRYVMNKGLVLAEGCAVETDAARFYITTTPWPGWKEVNPESDKPERARQEALYMDLLKVAKEALK